MAKSRTRTGNKRQKRVFVCLGCKFVYSSRHGNPLCPRCGRKHHGHRKFAGLIFENRRQVRG